MDRGRMWLATIMGAVLGAGGAYVIGPAGPGDARGQGFTATPEQLKTNQRISQAAVRRSNRALNYLAPVRTAATDAADTGSNGVRSLSSIPGAGAGWTGAQIADGAVSEGKLSGPLAARLPAWIVKVDNAAGAPVTRASVAGISMTRLATGTYLSDFGRNVSACAWTATATVDSGVPAAQAVRTMPDPGGDPNKVLTETFNGPGFLVDSGVVVKITC